MELKTLKENFEKFLTVEQAEFKPKSYYTVKNFIPVSEALPNTDRLVFVQWEDGSTSENALAFYDEIEQLPRPGKSMWFAYPSNMKLPDGSILAWKDIPEDEIDSHLNKGWKKLTIK